MFQPTILSRPLKEGYFQCTACEHWCAVAPGAAGKCGVRRNLDGALRLVVYGKAVATHVDPVEKKPLHHFLPGSEIFSVGTFGCNLNCAWCQNWEISQHRHFDPEADDIGQSWSPEKIVETCVRKGIPLVAFTYNEPAVFLPVKLCPVPGWSQHPSAGSQGKRISQFRQGFMGNLHVAPGIGHHLVWHTTPGPAFRRP